MGQLWMMAVGVERPYTSRDQSLLGHTPRRLLYLEHKPAPARALHIRPPAPRAFLRFLYSECWAPLCVELKGRSTIVQSAVNYKRL
eukprot:scaffold17843_cov131-Isochrysis_galbana.AAC.3